MSPTEDVRVLDVNLRDHIDTFRVVMLAEVQHTIFPELLEVFGPDAIARFIELLGGARITVPNKTTLKKMVRDTNIYARIIKCDDAESRKSTTEVLAVRYNITPEVVTEIFNKVRQLRETYHKL